MKKTALIVFILLSGCKLQTENSSSTDAQTYPSVTVTGTPAFMAANAVFRKACASCHPYSSMNEAQLIAAGLVNAGQPTTSPVYFRILGSVGGGGPKNMPPTTSVSGSDIALIATWINGI